jgi:hypothetical protein
MKEEDLRRRLFPGGVMRQDVSLPAFRCGWPDCSVERIWVVDPGDSDVLYEVILGECDHPWSLTQIDLPGWA